MCWEVQGGAGAEGVDVVANPSQAELLQRTVTAARQSDNTQRKQALLEKYGAQPAELLDPRIRLGQSEAYAEYSWGTPPVARDIHDNHLSVREYHCLVSH